MSSRLPTSDADAWAELAALAASDAAPREFWPRCAQLAREATDLPLLLVLHRPAQQPWRIIASAADTPAARRLSGEEFIRQAPDLAARALAEPGEFPRAWPGTDGRAHGTAAAAVPVASDGEHCLLLALTPSPADSAAAAGPLRAVALIPAAYESRLASRRTAAENDRLSGVLDVSVAAAGADRFGAAAQAFVNAVAGRYQCPRVSLGWLVAGSSRLVAVSRQDRFDRRQEAARLIEAAMDECLDQDTEVAAPAPADAGFIARDHAALAGSGHVLSLPLRHGPGPVAALLCERESPAFSDDEIRALRLAADQIAPRLVALRDAERWAGARLRDWVRRRAASLVGPRHTILKLSALLLAILLAVLVFWRTDYRVEGNFLLRTERISNLTAPFDGYIKEVLVRPGDKVKTGEVLLRLDTESLRVEESAAAAELERQLREEEKARAARKTADMRIAASMARQAKARLDVIRHRLAQAEIRSGMDGVVLEGDLKERLDAPVKQGDPLFRVGQLSGFYADVQLDERDAHEVAAGAAGEVAFLSRPDRSLPVTVELVLPAALEKEGVGVFAARARFAVPEDPEWRPGMSGIAKLHAGRRSLLWILTHRTIDFLRLKLWW